MSRESMCFPCSPSIQSQWGAKIFPSHLAMNHEMRGLYFICWECLIYVLWIDFLKFRTDHTATIFCLPFQSLLFCRLLILQKLPSPNHIGRFWNYPSFVIKHLITCVRTMDKEWSTFRHAHTWLQWHLPTGSPRMDRCHLKGWVFAHISLQASSCIEAA